MKRVLIFFVLAISLLCTICLGIGALIFVSEEGLFPQFSAMPDKSFIGPTLTTDGITVTSTKFTNRFPEQLLFRLEAKSDVRIIEVAFFAQIDGVSSTSRQAPEFTADTSIQALYEWDLGRYYLPPGATGQYWWTIQDSSGHRVETPKQSFRIDDPTHQWRKLANDTLALYWYAGDDNFGQEVFDHGVKTLKFLEQDMGVTLDRQVQMLIYGDRRSFLNAIGSSRGYEYGMSFYDYSIILIQAAPWPWDLNYAKAGTAHELTHQFIYQKIRGPFGHFSMPAWMDEGLAMYYQSYPESLDPEYESVLRGAIQDNTLIPIRSLSGGFPPKQPTLAYSQSYSMLDFIIQRYGRKKIAELLQAFKEGGFYDDILRQVLGVDTDGLEAEWRIYIGAKPRVIATRFAVTPTAIPTLGLSIDFALTPNAMTPTPIR